MLLPTSSSLEMRSAYGLVEQDTVSMCPGSRQATAESMDLRSTSKKFSQSHFRQKKIFSEGKILKYRGINEYWHAIK